MAGRVVSPAVLFDKDIYEETVREHLENEHLATLNLRSCRLKYDIWKDISERKIQIDELRLDYSELRENIEGLPKCLVDAQVKKLSLIDTELDTGNLRAFHEELSAFDRKETKLHSLNLMHVEIDSSGFKVLAKILNLLPVVEELNVTNSELNNKAIKAFNQIISDQQVIRKLALGRNADITPNGMLEVGKVAKNCKVEELDLSVCYLSDEHLKKLSKTLPQNITTLDLSKNMRLSPGAILILGKNWNKKLKIVLRDCWFDSQHVEMLNSKLPKCRIIGDESVEDKRSQAQDKFSYFGLASVVPDTSSRAHPTTSALRKRDSSKTFPDLSVEPPTKNSKRR